MGSSGSAVHRSTAAISTSRRGVCDFEASSTRRAQRSKSTGKTPGRAAADERLHLAKLVGRGVDEVLGVLHARDDLEVAQEPEEGARELPEIDAAVGGASERAQRRARVAREDEARRARRAAADRRRPARRRRRPA